MANRIVQFFTSLRLTVVLLVFAIILVFVGTLAQVHEGLYLAQARYFKSWFIFAPTIGDTQWKVLLPGGYLIGTLLLINLAAAHIKRFQFTRKKLGIHLTHGGLILLLLGQLLTDVLSRESALRLAEGEARNYSVDFRDNELVVIDTSPADHDQVVAIPEKVLERQEEVRHPQLPVSIRVLKFWPNAVLLGAPSSNSIPVAATQGFGVGLHLIPAARTVSMEERDLPAALVEVTGPQGPLGTWFVSSQTSARQEFTAGGRSYQIALRFARHYKPFSIKLLEFTHEKYRGTDRPRNFASRIRIQQGSSDQGREVVISMNNPLRYAGETFYQASFDKNNDQLANKVTILQVVRNPSWLTPYVACAMMALGMTIQFLTHLVGFTAKRQTA